MKFNFKQTAIALAVASAGVSGAANAALLESVLNVGTNVLNDISAEVILRPDGAGGYTPVTVGSVAAGDVFGGFIDIERVNGTLLDVAGFEFTGLFLGTITSTTAPVADTANPGGFAYMSTDLTFGLASSADWMAIFGIDLSTFGPVDLTGALSLFFEDAGNDLNILANAGSIDFATALANTKDGNLMIATGLVAGDAFTGDDLADVPAAMAGGIPGTTAYGEFSLETSVIYEALGGDILSKVFGSGNNVTSDLANFGVRDRSDFSFNYVPEPGTLAVLSAGLLGLGFVGRRRKSS
ncbi:MAG: PEP-CTERM sorting domain-containing protein [Chromatiaceae bacterium]|nr:PEP-CTERM sorting domain-containing protein [Chromatiaceae bacterium]